MASITGISRVRVCEYQLLLVLGGDCGSPAWRLSRGICRNPSSDLRVLLFFGHSSSTLRSVFLCVLSPLIVIKRKSYPFPHFPNLAFANRYWSCGSGWLRSKSVSFCRWIDCWQKKKKNPTKQAVSLCSLIGLYTISSSRISDPNNGSPECAPQLIIIPSAKASNTLFRTRWEKMCHWRCSHLLGSEHYSLFCTLITCLLLNVFPCAAALPWNSLCSVLWQAVCSFRTHFDTLHTLYRLCWAPVAIFILRALLPASGEGIFSSRFCNVTVNRCDWKQWDMWLYSELVLKKAENGCRANEAFKRPILQPLHSVSQLHCII